MTDTTATTSTATTLSQGDTLSVPVTVLDVKASDHGYFGPHDIVTFEVTTATGDLPAGLRFTVRRPHDGSNDLRSTARKESRTRGRADKQAIPEPSATMTLVELSAICDARGIDTGAKPTKAKLLKLLTP